MIHAVSRLLRSLPFCRFVGVALVFGICCTLGAGAAPLSAQGLEQGTADGLLFNAGLVRLDHAYSYLRRQAKGADGGQGEAEKTFTVVVISDRALDERDVRTEELLAERAKAEKLNGLQLIIDDLTGEVDQVRIYAPPSAPARAHKGSDVHWLAEEFDQNTARGGSSYRASDGSWGFAVQFHALIRRAPQYLAEGEAMGKLTIAGEEITLQHALSWVEDREGTSLTHIVLSDREVSLAEVQDAARLAALGAAGRAAGLRVTLRDEDGAIESQTWFARRLGDRRAEVATAVGSDWEAEEFTDTVVRGRLLSGGRQEALGLAWEYDAYFAASIWEEEAH